MKKIIEYIEMLKNSRTLRKNYNKTQIEFLECDMVNYFNEKFPLIEYKKEHIGFYIEYTTNYSYSIKHSFSKELIFLLEYHYPENLL